MAPFCSERKIDLIQRSVGAAADLLAMFYEKGLSYSSINTVRCALSAILDPYGASRTTFCQHPDIKRFMKDIFQCRSPVPGKNKTWDVNIVLQCIISMDDSPSTQRRYHETIHACDSNYTTKGTVNTSNGH